MSDLGYLEPALTYRGDELAVLATQRLMALRPGWQPEEGHLAVHVLEVVARLVGESRVVASAVPKGIFRYYGQTVLGLMPVDAAPARAASTWVANDDLGYTVEAGTLVGVRRSGDDLVAFQVETPVTIAPGATTTEPGAVQLVAVDTGSEANGLAAGGQTLLDHLAWVASVTTTEETTGGVDAESDATYLDRLTSELRLLTPRPILPGDFAVLARRVPGVYRALAIDGYNPTTDTDDNERTVAVAVVDQAGEPVSAPVKAQVEATLESMREVNFVVKVMDPTYTVIDVAVSFTVALGYQAAAVEADVDAALARMLSPAVYAGGDMTPPQWLVDTDTVRYLEVAEVVNRVPGVNYITALTINESGEPPGTANVALTGRAPLVQPGVITTTVV